MTEEGGERSPSTRPLWRHRDFLALWAGQTVSEFGSQVTQVAGPLAAALTLHVSPAQMGLLRAVASAPELIFGLGAGAWADRIRRRPLLIAANLVRAAALGSIPVAALLGMLQVGQLYAVFAVAALAGAAFGAAFPAYLPALVDRDATFEANTRLVLSAKTAQTAGPALGGALVQALGGPLAIAVDAGSFLVSALSLLGIRAAEPHPAGPGGRRRARRLLSSIGEGLRYVGGDPLLRALAGTAGIFNLFDGVIFAVYVLFVTRGLHLAPAALGAIFAGGGAGGLVGALMAGRVGRRLGVGPALVGSVALATAGEVLIPFAGGPAAVALILLAGAELMVGVGVAVWSITTTTLRQVSTPTAYQGRVNATMRVMGGLEPVGAIAGGVLGQLFGLRTSLFVGAAGTLLAVVWLLLSPVRSATTPR